ncbi:MAG TPA: hypothetical protein VG425_16640, partial [Casimicrobiaceae bacterium]|nr:hypothetical protein [Casimicrobiaceae bacterium]
HWDDPRALVEAGQTMSGRDFLDAMQTRGVRYVELADRRGEDRASAAPLRSIIARRRVRSFLRRTRSRHRVKERTRPLISAQ